MTLFSCKGNRGPAGNPLTAEWDTPFGIPPFDLIKPAHYQPALVYAMELHRDEIDRIADNGSVADFDNTIKALDSAGELYERIRTLLSLVTSADKTDAMIEVNNRVTPLMSAHDNDIYLNDKLFQRVKTVWQNRHDAGLDPLQIRLTEKTYQGFVRAGADLTEEQKDELRQIEEKLSMAQLRFGNNVLEADRKYRMTVDTADVQGLPIGLREAAAATAAADGQKGRFSFTLGRSSITPFLTLSSRGHLRKAIYDAYLDRCNEGSDNDNRSVINEIVTLRDRKARLMGYETFADYVLEQRMASTAGDVYALLDGVWEPALEKARAELTRMEELKTTEEPGQEFVKSDWWYYAEKVRKADYSLDEETIKNFFSVKTVQDGVFDLCNRLYGLTFHPLNNIALYHKDCTAYEVLDEDNTHLGILITDYIAREGYKSPGAWCGSYRTRTYRDGGRIDPIVTVVCNFPAPAGHRPSLLTIDQTLTMFHEYGHAIHALMTDVPYKGLVRVERDFVELPSQIMENWALEPEMLRRYAMHYSTSNPISEALIEKITQSATFNQGFQLTELIAAGYTDMDIHTLAGFDGVDVNDFERRMLIERRGLIEEIAPRYRYPYFNHIFSGGYAAGYYSYLWSEVLDKDAYEAFLESGNIFDRRVARSFRRNVLEKGGSEDGMEMYLKFRGAEPSREPLMWARGLVERPPRQRDDIPFQPWGDDDDDEGEQADSTGVAIPEGEVSKIVPPQQNSDEQ